MVAQFGAHPEILEWRFTYSSNLLKEVLRAGIRWMTRLTNHLNIVNYKYAK